MKVILTCMKTTFFTLLYTTILHYFRHYKSSKKLELQYIIFLYYYQSYNL